MIKTVVMDGVTIRNITPELSEEERRERINELAEALIAFDKKRKNKAIQVVESGHNPGSVTTELKTIL